MKYYIAFSIHGTNCFITATLTPTKYTHEQHMEMLGEDFKVAQSRRPDYNLEKDGYKLEWNKLLNKQGEPLRSPPAILNRFKILERMGFVIDKEAFVKKHYKKGVYGLRRSANPV